MNVNDALKLQREWMATHKVSSGFQSVPGGCFQSIGCCARCGREYLAQGTQFRCYTCEGENFALYDEQPPPEKRWQTHSPDQAAAKGE